MRIDYSYNYYGHKGQQGCDVDDCQRHYCNIHRMLWRDCDTAEADFEGSGKPVWMLGDPPCCRAVHRREEAERYRREWEAKHERSA